MNDLHAKWPHRWISSKAEARKSPIHGLGVFAKEKISAGEMVGVLGGVIVPKSEIREYWDLMTHVGIQFNEDFFIVPTTHADLEQKGVYNHSCDPNIGFSSSISFVAIRDIEPGEELTFDYAFNETYHDSFQCECRATNCRKIVGPDDYMLPGMQERYGKYFSPYIKKRLGI